MHCDVNYYPAKFELKFKLCMEKQKRQIVLWGKMN